LSTSGSALRPGRVFADVRTGLKVVVLAPARQPGVLAADGRTLTPARPDRCSATSPSFESDRTQAGRVYSDAESGLVVSCIAGGPGELTFAGRRLAMLPPRVATSAGS
jgi:hypothetical protein